MKIDIINSKNFDPKKRSKKEIKFIIIHYTGMQSERESIKRLCNPKSKVSCHYVINQKGKIYRLVKDNKIAWHAGKSCWKKYKNLNTPQRNLLKHFINNISNLISHDFIINNLNQHIFS